jgi:hypothetical protein
MRVALLRLTGGVPKNVKYGIHVLVTCGMIYEFGITGNRGQAYFFAKPMYSDSPTNLLKSSKVTIFS